MKSYKSKNGKIKNNIKNKSSILFLMNQKNATNQKNNFIDYSIITDASLILPNKIVSEIHKNKTIYNKIKPSQNNKNVLNFFYRKPNFCWCYVFSVDIYFTTWDVLEKWSYIYSNFAVCCCCWQLNGIRIYMCY